VTLALAIAAQDRIVVAADGKVFDTERGVLNKAKLFRLSNNCVAAVSGMGLKDNLDTFMAGLAANIADQRLQGAVAITAHVKDFLNTRAWAEWKDPKKSHMVMIIAGYQNSTPQVYVRLSTGAMELIGLDRYAVGNWDDAINYLLEALDRKDYQKIKYKVAEKIAAEMLAKGEAANPDEIGGDGLVWHVLPHKIEAKSTAYAIKLRRKHVSSATA
jgi:20S proteasome alpha/beta subunit